MCIYGSLVEAAGWLNNNLKRKEKKGERQREKRDKGKRKREEKELRMFELESMSKKHSKIIDSALAEEVAKKRRCSLGPGREGKKEKVWASVFIPAYLVL